MNVNRIYVIQFLLVIILIFSHILFIYIIGRKTDRRKCPGYLDSTYGQCTDDGKHYLAFVKRKEDSCDPTIYELQRRDIVLFAGKLLLQYITDKRENNLSLLHAAFLKKNMTIYQGIFYFLLKPFLTVLPTDFGQNFITPYGTPSFLADYISCIPDLTLVCKDLIKDPEQTDTCLKYFEVLNQKFKSDSPPNCQNIKPDLYNNPLYVELGLLGAMTINPNQAIIISGTIPKRIGLKYWSFTPYLADRYNDTDTCTPFNNIYFSSLTDPFNNFTHYTESDFTFAIIISINPDVGDKMYNFLSTQPQLNLNYIHRFDLPSGPNTMIVQPNLLNPNHLTNEDITFNYQTDRLAVLFRMNVIHPDSNEFEEFKLNPHFENYIVDLGDSVDVKKFYSGILLPPLKTPFPLQTNESFLHDTLNGIKKNLETSFKNNFSSKMIHGFNSLLGTFAPLDRGVYYNHFSYESGRQAIQMASNANGDNPDTWYKISKPECLSMDDILMCVCVNHTLLKNSIYCNINVLDKQMGRGIASIEIFEDDKKLLAYPFYSVIISRNKELLNEFKESLLSLFGEQIFIYDYFVQTGDTMHWNVPICHQLLFIERTYLNPTIPLEDGSFVYYRNENVPSTEWNKLTRPDGNDLLNPIFMKFTKKKFNVWVIIIMVIIIILLLILLIFLMHKTSKIKRSK